MVIGASAVLAELIIVSLPERRRFSHVSYRVQSTAWAMDSSLPVDECACLRDRRAITPGLLQALCRIRKCSSSHILSDNKPDSWDSHLGFLVGPSEQAVKLRCNKLT